MLLQQSSWQNNVRMSSLVEQVRFLIELTELLEFAFTVIVLIPVCYYLSQIRGPLSTIRTLSKMLSVHTKKSEVCTLVVSVSLFFLRHFFISTFLITFKFYAL